MWPPTKNVPGTRTESTGVVGASNWRIIVTKPASPSPSFSSTPKITLSVAADWIARLSADWPASW
ncbi:MAG TPA: hypothetical protein EYP98_17935 [Planctomycetes bacterium]|nr:hypothetical protein [Planctomycetota bacterium]